MPLTQAMFGIAHSRPAAPPAPPAPLGTALVALRVHGAVRLPPGCVELVFSAAGQARRAPPGRAGKGELVIAYHPGPYETVFAPFAGAPEIGLRLRYLVDAADPRLAQQRFDLFLFSEAGPALPVEALHQAIAAAVRDALAQGVLDLPACTTLDEWHGFRAGLNQLLYTRFGLTVDDCVPVDLGDVCDYAALLRGRAALAAPVAASTPAGGPAPWHAGRRNEPVAGDWPGDWPGNLPDDLPGELAAELARSPGSGMADPVARDLGRQPDGAAMEAPTAAATATLSGPDAGLPAGAGNVAAAAADAAEGHARTGCAALPLAPSAVPAAADAHALRRLFLELPAWAAGLRLLALPSATVTARRDLLQRCALAALDVNTMPALALAAPGRPLPAAAQARRAGHSVAALQALDQCWALLAHWRLAMPSTATADPAAALPAALLDEADRLTANLACHLAARRAVADQPDPAPGSSRKEPQR